MSSTDRSKISEKPEQSSNTVIEIKISIPPVLGGSIGTLLDGLGNAAKELAKVGRSFISTEEKEPSKMRRIEIK